MESLGFQFIFNTSYSPEHNPIEMIFAKVKQHFKAIKTNAIVNGTKAPTETIIRQSFDRVTKQDVANCINHSLDILKL